MGEKPLVVLVQPTMGLSGEFSRHPPISLLYVASGLRGLPVDIKILDHRLCPSSWEKPLREILSRRSVLFVGVTVMSGAPVENAIAVSKVVKEFGEIPVVWGGALPTVAPADVLRENFVDFTVSGGGIAAIKALAGVILDSFSDPGSRLPHIPAMGPVPQKSLELGNILGNIPGLGYKKSGLVFLNKPWQGFETLPYKSIPYELIPDYSSFGQIGSLERIFPIYSSYGCPYQCNFCISPALYRDFPRKWIPLPAEEVVDHIEFLIREYQATEIYFYDDDSFVQVEHISRLLGEVKKRGLKVRLSFRGIRVNEILKMDEALLNDLADSGTNLLHVGVESGSQRILDLFNKGITVADIIQMNRRLAKLPKIIAAYNWIIGTPTESSADVARTIRLLWRLIEENPRCLIFQPNKFRPLPGTIMEKLAMNHGYKKPENLQEWVQEETEGEKQEPWHSRKMTSLIRMCQVTSFFIDRKAELLLKKSGWKYMAVRLFTALYRPLARFRFKYRLTPFLLEYPIFQWAKKRVKL